jgi:hypothetical protein
MLHTPSRGPQVTAWHGERGTGELRPRVKAISVISDEGIFSLSTERHSNAPLGVQRLST